MTPCFVYADRDQVPRELDAIVSAEHFGDIIFRRKRLVDHVAASLRSFHTNDLVVLGATDTVPEFSRRIANVNCDRVVHIPSWLAVAESEVFHDRIKRLLLVDEPLFGTLGNNATPLIAMGPEAYNALIPRFFGNAAPGLGQPEIEASPIDLGTAFVDIRQPLGLIDLLSGAFSARHFNSIERSANFVRKRSRNIGKVRAEHDFFYALPPEMQRWMVMPFDLRVEADSASYAMERLLVLDAGQQWINGSISPLEFQRFLDDLFAFFDARPKRLCSAARARENFDALYIEKVRKRVAQMQAHPLGAKLDQIMSSATPYNSLSNLEEAYLSLASLHRSAIDNREVIGHGDSCFSNILYDKRIRLLKLIDPRGMTTPDTLYTDPLYDYAKLSHSVLGGYDFIVGGFYSLILDPMLRLRVHTPERNYQAFAQIFTRNLTEHGINCRILRILEASLFISMLPLHVDTPRNVVAFALIAAHILDEVQDQ